jgi:hypothetical protein
MLAQPLFGRLLLGQARGQRDAEIDVVALHPAHRRRQVAVPDRAGRGRAEDEVERRLGCFLGYDGSRDRTESHHVDPQIDDGVLAGRVPKSSPELLLGLVEGNRVECRAAFRCHTQTIGVLDGNSQGFLG